jgi:hypothetical protein
MIVWPSGFGLPADTPSLELLDEWQPAGERGLIQEDEVGDLLVRSKHLPRERFRHPLGSAGRDAEHCINRLNTKKVERHAHTAIELRHRRKNAP